MDAEDLAKVLGFLMPFAAGAGYFFGWSAGWKDCSDFWRREFGLPERRE